MTSKLIVLLLLSTFLYSSIFVTLQKLQNNQKLAEKKTFNGQVMGESVNVSAAIGSGTRFTIFGYTSPNADVQLQGVGVTSETTADKKTGYFSFDNVFTPIQSQEVCITSTDTVGRLSSPSCLPPFPINNNVNIGPVILAPSLSVSAGNVFVGQQAVLTGKTIPNRTIAFSFFKDQKSLFTSFVQQLAPILPSFIQERLLSMQYRVSNMQYSFTTHNHLFSDVEAFSFPSLSTTADKDGNYSIELPTGTKAYLRTFAQVDFDQNPSNKSLTLNIQIVPLWTIIMTVVVGMLKFIASHFITFVILLELVTIIYYFLHHYFHPFILARSREIILYEKKSIMIPEDRELLVRT